MSILRSVLSLGSAAVIMLSALAPTSASEKDGRLDIYFIDVEGGAATLFVTPSGEAMLIDSGAGDNNGRDRDRILAAIETAGVKKIDHAVVTHWHLDHYGNHAAVASKIPISQFWDRGIPDALIEDPLFADHIADYRRASQNKSKTLKIGDTIPLKSGKTPLSIRTVTASGEVIANSGPANPYADKHTPKEIEPTDNDSSLSLQLMFGPFDFLCCGDLTWNVEAKLVTPNNPIGQIDLFMATHHGLPVSNNPALVMAIDPKVAIVCNGPLKGGSPETLHTLSEVRSMEAWYQLHRNLRLGPNIQAPAERIANMEDTPDCKGTFIKASVAPDGESYTVQVGPNGKPRSFTTMK